MVMIGKLVRVVFSVWLVVSLVFVLMRMTGDPALALFGPDEVPANVMASFRATWGFDRPIIEQYLAYLANVAQGDFGRSFVEYRPALTIVVERIPNTLVLMGASFLITLLLGVPAGLASALRHNRITDTAITATSIFFYAMPNFVLGISLMLVFSAWLRVLPVGGSGSWQHILMPAVAFGASGAAVFARFVRASVLDILRQPYIVAALARGIPWRVIVIGHVLPNAALPLLTIGGLTIGSMVAGSVVIETMFAWPGVGRLTANAVELRDMAVIQVIIFVVMTMMVATNLAVDFLYTLVDPRIRVRPRSA